MQIAASHPTTKPAIDLRIYFDGIAFSGRAERFEIGQVDTYTLKKPCTVVYGADSAEELNDLHDRAQALTTYKGVDIAIVLSYPQGLGYDHSQCTKARAVVRTAERITAGDGSAKVRLQIDMDPLTLEHQDLE